MDIPLILGIEDKIWEATEETLQTLAWRLVIILEDKANYIDSSLMLAHGTKEWHGQ